MASKRKKIEGTEKAWEDRLLGASEKHVKAIEANEAEIDEALELQMISIRLQKSLIEDFKNIAALHGLGYQPLMRQVLARFAEAEKKHLLRQAASEHMKELEKSREERTKEENTQRKTA